MRKIIVGAMVSVDGVVASEPRLFKSADEEKARELQLLRSQGGLTQIEEQDLTQEYGAVTKIQPRHYELWLAKALGGA